MGIKVNRSSAYSPQSNSHAERLVRSCKNILQKHQKLSELQLDEMMLAVNPQVQTEGQCSAVDRFLGRSIINYIPNSFDNTFDWREAIKSRAEVRKKRVLKPQRGCKQTFHFSTLSVSRQVCKVSIDLLTLAGLSANISADGPANPGRCTVSLQTC